MGRTDNKPAKKIKTHIVEYEDQQYELAILSKGVDIGKAEKIKIAELICKAYETDNYTLVECCKMAGIGDRTFWQWRHDIAEIANLYISSDNNKDNIYRYRLKMRARTNAERLIDGYTKELKERSIEPTYDKDGNVQMVTTSIKIKEVYVKPSPKLIETILYNTDPKNFEKNPKPIEKMNKDVNIPPIQWIESEETDNEVS